MLFGAAVGLSFGFAKSADIDALSDEAVYYAHGNAPDLAAAKYAELAKAVPDDPVVLLGKTRATLLSHVDDPTPAAADFARAVELLVKRGDKGAALLAFSELGPLFVERGQAIDPRTLLVLGSAAEGQGALPLAEEVYSAIAAQAPDCREAEKAAFRIPHVLLLQGSPERATEAWRTFVARYPSSEWIQYADGRLRA
jgi:TolA-binding protein